MPAQALWPLRIKEILKELRTLEAPVVDRAVCERLFKLKRRRTIDLLHCFGGYQAGRMLLIDRSLLIKQLNQMRVTADFRLKRQRKSHLGKKRR